MVKLLERICKVKDRSHTEEQILLAAEKIFSRHGFNGATTRQIAQESGVNLSLINRYFDGKAGLLITLLNKKREEVLTGQLEYPIQETFEAELLKHLDGFFDRLTENIDFFRIIICQFLGDEEFLKRFRQTLNITCVNPEVMVRLTSLAAKQNLDFSEDEIVTIIDDLESYVVMLIQLYVIIENAPATEVKEKLYRYSRAYFIVFAEEKSQATKS